MGMKWNKQRIAIMVVLGLAGGAFCVDRFVLGYGPSAAAGSPSDLLIKKDEPAGVPGAEPKAPAVANGPGTNLPTITAAERVAHLAAGLPPDADVGETDAFVIPAVWIREIHAGEDQKTKPVHPAPSPEQGLKFTLTSVVWNKDHKQALACTINGRLLRLVSVEAGDDEIDGYRLIRVEGPQGPKDTRDTVAVLEAPGGAEVRVIQRVLH